MPNATLLRRALWGNALFSVTSATALAVAPEFWRGVLGLPLTWPLYLGAAGLLLFALYVAQVARAPERRLRDAMWICAMDAAWVVSSIALILALGGRIPSDGQLAVLLVAAAVGGFCAAQWAGLRRFTQESSICSAP